MSVLDLTLPAAYLNAIKAANEKDHRIALLLLEQSAEALPKKRRTRKTAILKWAFGVVSGLHLFGGMRSEEN